MKNKCSVVLIKQKLILVFTLVAVVLAAYTVPVYKYNDLTGLWELSVEDESYLVLPPDHIQTHFGNTGGSIPLNGEIVIQPLAGSGVAPFGATKGQWYYYMEYLLEPGNSSNYALWAGQSIYVGTVNISNDGNELVVSFSLTGNWYAEESQLKITAVPPSGNQVPGQFPYSQSYTPYVTGSEYHIGFQSLFQNMTAQPMPKSLKGANTIYVLLHVSVLQVEGGEVISQETAWGGGDEPPSMCVEVSTTRVSWYVRKPGSYLSKVLNVSVSSEEAVTVTFSGFSNVSGPEGGSGGQFIPTFFAPSDTAPDEDEWLLADDLNNLFILGTGSFSFSLWQKLVVSGQTAGVYRGVGTVLFTIQNSKSYVEK